MDTERAVEHRASTPSRPERRTHVIEAPLLRFDLDEETAELRREPSYAAGDRNAKTLVKSGHYRLVLVALKAGGSFDEDDPRGYVSLLVREGRLSVAVGDGRLDVGKGQVAAIDTGNRFSAVALEDTVVLMNFSWPPQP